MAFSGGSYDEVARWLKNFLSSHAKREDPRIEVRFDTGDEREDKSYGARLRLGDRLTPTVAFDWEDVAAHRGNFAWCAALATRTRQTAREHLLSEPASAPR